MTLPTVEECEGTFAGYEAVVGFVEELDCGETPDATEPAEQGQYYDDDGTYRFYPFGTVTSFDGKMNTNQTKFRGIGNRGINCNVHGKYETTVDLTYHPHDTRRLYYVLGIVDSEGSPVYDTSTLTDAVCMGDCLPTSSILKKIASVCDGDPDQYYLYNNARIKTFSVSVDNEGAVEWTENLIPKFEQLENTRVFTEPLQNVTVGYDPLDPCCSPFMFYEGDVWITRFVTENVSSEIVNPSTTQIVVENAIFDFNRDGTVDGNPGGIDNCFYDVRVKVNGSYVTISSVLSTDTRYITLDSGVDPGDTVIVEYNKFEQLFYATSYDFTVEWNTEGLQGIYRGLAIPYEIRSKVYDITGSLTTNFRNIYEYRQYVQDEWFHIFFQQGGMVVFQMLYAKWDAHEAPLSEEDLIENTLPFTAARLCVDSEIRLPSEGEEEGSSSGDTGSEDMYPIVNGFE